MAEQKLRDKLALRHPCYEERLAEWNLLDDSWSGRGGFLPPLDSPSWGAAGPKWAELPSYRSTSYVVPFTRERYPHWQQRVRTACYVNHYRKIAETILGFLRRSPIQIENLPPELTSWRRNADGLGHTLDELVMGPLAENMLRFGWSPSCVDRPAVAAANGAEAAQAGWTTFAVVRDPRSMIAWGEDDKTGQLQWVRFEDRILRWADPLAAPDVVTRWTQWSADEVAQWEWIASGDRKMEDAQLVEGFPRANPTKRLPVVVGFHGGPQPTFAIPDAPLLSTALLGLWLYNRGSEETDLHRQRGFPILCWPVQKGMTPRGIKAGTDNAVPYPSEGNPPIYLQPDGSSAASYDTLIKRGSTDMYEQSRTDFSRSGAQVESGVSRAIRFQALNANMVSFGQSLVTVARSMAELAVAWNAPEGTAVDPVVALADAKFTAPTDYDVEDLDRELEQLETGMRIGMGPTAEGELRKQARDRLVTFTDPELLERSNAEIDAEAETRRKRSAGGEEIPPAGQGDTERTWPVGVAEGEEQPTPRAE